MSLFDIPENDGVLPRRMFADTELRQVAAMNAINGESFSNGTHTFRLSAGGPAKWLVPQRSFFVIKVKLVKEKSTGLPLKLEDNIALAQNAAAALFSNIEVRMGGEVITSTHANLPQVDTLRQRLDRSGAWFNSIGKALNSWDTFEGRLHAVCSDGKGVNRQEVVTKFQDLGYQDTHTITIDAGGIVTITQAGGATTTLPADQFKIGDIIQYDNKQGRVIALTDIDAKGAGAQTQTLEVQFGTPTLEQIATSLANAQFYRVRNQSSSTMTEMELVWQPPSPLFSSIQHAIPEVGDIEINLHPAVDYKRQVVESRGVKKLEPSSGASNNDYHFEVTNMHFYAMELRSKSFLGDQFFLDLHDVQAQTASIDTKELQETAFTVSRNTEALTVAFSDRRLQQDTRVSATGFKSYQTDLDSTGNLVSQDMLLERLQVNYAGRQYPPNLQQLGFIGSQNWLTQRYVESLIYAGKLDMEARAETFDEWIERGPYFHWRVDKERNDDSTRVIVKTQFKDGFEAENLSVVLFEHKRLVVKVNVGQNRRVSGVQVTV